MWISSDGSTGSAADMRLDCAICEKALQLVGCITRANGELVCKKNGCSGYGIKLDIDYAKEDKHVS